MWHLIDTHLQGCVSRSKQKHDVSRAAFTQLVNNACSTQAILSILLNCKDMLDIGDGLRSFRDSTKDYAPLVSERICTIRYECYPPGPPRLMSELNALAYLKGLREPDNPKPKNFGSFEIMQSTCAPVQKYYDRC
jgi:hypothetical protein